MKQLEEQARALMAIYAQYDLDTQALESLVARMKEAKINIPIVGNFSAGKSALCNALLGYSENLLTENITPETAVPTELLYSADETMEVIYKDGSVVAINEIPSGDETMAKLRLCLEDDFLGSIPNVILVDMPGFESGYDAHNQAIAQYLPTSLAYLVAFPADNMTVRTPMANFLKELSTYKRPIAVVITKCNHVPEGTLNLNLAHLKQSLAKYIDCDSLPICITESYSGYVDEVKTYLTSIQAQSQDLLQADFEKLLAQHSQKIKAFLSGILQKANMSEADTQEQIDAIMKKIQKAEDTIKPLSKKLDQGVISCISQIKKEASEALNNHTESFVTALMKKQDIELEINTLLRPIIQRGYADVFIPCVDTYLETVCASLNAIHVSDAGATGEHCKTYDIAYLLSGAGLAAGGMVAGGMVTGSTVATLLPTMGIMLGVPVIGAILASIGGIVALITYILNSKQKKETVMQELRSKFHSEVYPQILAELEISLRTELTVICTKIKQAVEEEVADEREKLKQELKAVKELAKAEDDKKQTEIHNIQVSLDAIGGMICGH